MRQADPEEQLEWVAEMEETEGKTAAFASKRSAHYNEFERLRQWRAEHGEDDEDDD